MERPPPRSGVRISPSLRDTPDRFFMRISQSKASGLQPLVVLLKSTLSETTPKGWL